MVMQLWHLGRAASADCLKSQGGFDVVSASDVPFTGGAVPRPLTVEEIAATVQDYAKAAKNFVEGSGGDGVELHSANGYCTSLFLLHPLLQSLAEYSRLTLRSTSSD